MALFFFIVLGVWTLMHAYVFWRASSVPVVASHVPTWLLVALAVFLWGSYLLSRSLDRFIPVLGRALEILGAMWIGVLFLAFVALLAADFLTGFGYLAPALARPARGSALAVAAVLSAIGVVQALRPPVVSSYDVAIAGLPARLDGTLVVLVSDTHIGSLLDEQWLGARISQIEALRPDLVVLAGDIAEGGSDSTGRVLPVLSRLRAPLGVWAVTGNHEGFGRRARTGSILDEAGFHVLHDRWAEAAPGLVVCGVDDLTSRRRYGATGNFVDRALAGRPPGAAVFISHTPWEAERAAAAGAGLMLSAHTHNGQIWPFNYFVRFMYPRIAGLYSVAGMPLIVCRGTGTWGPRMRLWQRGELLRVTLHSSEKRP